METNLLKDQMLTAAFIFHGLQDARKEMHDKPDFCCLLRVWNKGCIELVEAPISYVPFITRVAYAAASANECNYPGVFDYEVSSSFGRWFGEFIFFHGGDEPSQREAHEWLANEIGVFFSQGASLERANAIKAAIEKECKGDNALTHNAVVEKVYPVLNVPSRKGGEISIDVAMLNDVLTRFDIQCTLATRLCNEMEDAPDKAASEFDTEELLHHSQSDYSTEIRQELRDLVNDLGEAVT